MSYNLYKRNFRKMKPWEKTKMWVDKGLQVAHPFYSLFKMFDCSILSSTGFEKFNFDRMHLYQKFYSKYPDAGSLPLASSLDPENPSFGSVDYGMRFVRKQTKYIDEGFSEEKAFEMVEKDMGGEIQKEKYERSLFEGLATSNKSRTLMSYYEQEAEYEARQKIKQLERMLPEYKRYQGDLEKTYDKILNDKEEYVEEERMNMNNYEPATCNIK